MVDPTALAALHEPHAELLRSALHAMSPLGVRLALDIGAGPGLKTSWLAKHMAPGGQIIGIDINRLTPQATSQPMLRLTGDAHWLPLRAACADLAWCVAVLGLLDDPELALSEVRRTLRPGGILLLASAARLYVRPRIWPAAVGLAAGTNLLPLSPADDLGTDLCTRVAQAGFDRISLQAFLLDPPGLPLLQAQLPLLAWEELDRWLRLELDPELQAECEEAEYFAEPDLAEVLLIVRAEA